MRQNQFKWRDLGLSRETITSFKDKVAADNLSILFLESPVLALLCFFVSFAMMICGYPIWRHIVLLINSFVDVIIFFVAREIRRNGANNLSRAVNALIGFFELSLYAMSIYIGIYGTHNYAALFVGSIVICLVSFDRIPEMTMAETYIPIIIYLFLGFKAKPIDVFIFDATNVLCASILGMIVSWKKARVKYEYKEAVEIIEKNNSLLYKNSLTDPLTGLLNRRMAFDRLEVLSAQSSVAKKPIVVMIMDIDRFKVYNDTYGHPAGDKLLSDLGKFLLTVQRKYNITIARIGGEEFMAFFVPEKELTSQSLSQEILEGVRGLEHAEKGKHATVSIGIYENIAQNNDNGSRVYSKADRAVYEAKKNGRDRVEYYDNTIEK